MQYLTFEEYKSIGGSLDSAAFDRYSIRAFSRVTQETRNRIDGMKGVPVEVKHLCRDLIEYMYNNQKQEKTIVSASQSQGGASESESYASKTQADLDNEIESLIYDYLSAVTDDKGTYLLYRGCLND